MSDYNLSVSKKFIVPGLVLVLIVVVALVVMSNKDDSAASGDNSKTITQSESISAAPVDASPSGELKIEDIKVGTGKEVKSGDTVTINYVGTLENGQKFDSSYDRNQAFVTQIGVGQVIKGWDEGVIGMKVGGKRKLTIPPDLGYGSRDMGVIPPNSTLIFELELLDVK